MLRSRGLIALAAIAILALWPAAGQAQEAYPSRTVKIVIPSAPGSTTDTLARLVADQLGQKWSKATIVENIPGGAMNIGASAVARAAPDGYTLMVAPPSPLSFNHLLYRDPGYEPGKFVPITMLAKIPNVLVVRKDFPAASLKELVDYAKGNPGKLNFASSGHGLAAHLAGELFKAEAKIDIVHVPYKGAAPALQDVIAGHVQMMFATASSVVPHIQDGKVRPLAVATLKRTAVLPDIPTIDELGTKNFDATTWHGLVAPARTPRDIVATLNRALVATLDDPSVKKSLGDLGVDIIGGTPEDFAAYIKSEIPKWTAIIKASGAKLD
jgi:tripartite-type tricarboxylate transporter receptor subunit TctC